MKHEVLVPDELPPIQAQVAFIDEQRCIGCTLCIKACPVDAIIGAAQQMHTVIEEYCIGCELCIAPCPVDCISMLPSKNLEKLEKRARVARRHFELRTLRLDKTFRGENTLSSPCDDRKKTIIAAALHRARQKRNRVKN